MATEANGPTCAGRSSVFRRKMRSGSSGFVVVKFNGSRGASRSLILPVSVAFLHGTLFKGPRIAPQQGPS